jgi:hypothetical protein
VGKGKGVGGVKIVLQLVAAIINVVRRQVIHIIEQAQVGTGVPPFGDVKGQGKCQVIVPQVIEIQVSTGCYLGTIVLQEDLVDEIPGIGVAYCEDILLLKGV